MSKSWNETVDAGLAAADDLGSDGKSRYILIKEGDELYYIDSAQTAVITVKITRVEGETENQKVYYAESVPPPDTAKPAAFTKYGVVKDPELGVRYRFLRKDLGVILFLDFGIAMSQNRRLMKRKKKDPSYVYPGQRNVRF